MLSLEKRSRQLIGKVAAQAAAYPKQANGLWFEDEISLNFYAASYLFAASLDADIRVRFDREQAKQNAEDVFRSLLQLQDVQEDSATYGLWSSNVESVELMGILMVYFVERCGDDLSPDLRAEFEKALQAIYQSRFYDIPLQDYGHQDAKYTASKLIFGYTYGDGELLEEGRRSLQQLLHHVKEQGMSEYSAPSWFWHWVQAFTCVRLLLDDPEVTDHTNQILDYLWNERSLYYIGGAWAGPHAHIQPGDAPKDGNVAFDYLQYGDFRLPPQLLQYEYAGFLFYEAPEEARIAAMDRLVPVEVKKNIPKMSAEGSKSMLHSYTYLTDAYAVGGMWEYDESPDQVQHRWDVTLPLSYELGSTVNQAYMIHPKDSSKPNNLLHGSSYTHILPDRSVVMAMYTVPQDEHPDLVGVLPKGEWIYDEKAMFGLVGGVYLAVFIRNGYQKDEQDDRILLSSTGHQNAVVFEAASVEEAESLDAEDLEEFADLMRERAPMFSEDGNRLQYRSLHSRKLELSVTEVNKVQAQINGQLASFHDHIK
ncbi:hypothetical protein [Saccharibacillus sp. JS10]|uniref:hypothetical protein n=1 Tax=Saccharibacillus sp. JS10 TaxID=2950552 RepID=UPI00210924EA|nr:hypothetical protein [Saccharibacillus sp. JS10]MCQ4086816.1 hypothetical protein [Saccharibacillus sp. JS10]